MRALITAKFADCFTRISQFRVWNDGNADSQVRFPAAGILGGCGPPGDSYFAPLPVLATDCPYDVSVRGQLGHARRSAEQRRRELHGQRNGRR